MRIIPRASCIRLRFVLISLLLFNTGNLYAELLDIDRNNQTDALTDGLLIMRALSGWTGESLTNGAISPTAQRNAAAIAVYLETIREQLDVDADGRSDALTDGVLILRYQFGFRGEQLISDAIGPGAQNDTAEKVEAALRALNNTEVLAPPSDPQIVDVGVPPNVTSVSTLMYEGAINFSPGNQVDLSIFQVRSGASRVGSLSYDGRFSIRLNQEATALLRVVDANSKTVLLKVFPKAESLSNGNPLIDAKSTATALVGLQPGILTSDPMVDALILEIIERFPETQALADRIAFESGQGRFAVNDVFSPEVKTLLGSVMQRLAGFTVDDLISGEFSADDQYSAPFYRRLNSIASLFVKPAHAGTPIGTGTCVDGFNSTFSGNVQNADDLCVAADDFGTVTEFGFGLINNRSRWVHFRVLEEEASIGLIPPRHVDFLPEGLTGALFEYGEIVGASFIDIFSSYKIITDEDYLDEGGATDRLLRESFNKRFGPRESQARYSFQEEGFYTLASLGAAGSDFDVFLGKDEYWTSSFVLSSVTEFAIPLMSIVLDASSRDLFETVDGPRLNRCLANNLGLFLELPELATKIAELRSLAADPSSSNRDKAQAFFAFLGDLVLNTKIWKDVLCVFPSLDIAEHISNVLLLGALESVIEQTIGSVPAFLLKSGDSVANAALFLDTAFDETLAAEELYTLVVGDPRPTVSLEALPASITVGGSALLTWSSSETHTCSGTGFDTGGATSGNVEVSPVETTEYFVTCTGVGDPVVGTVEITVTAPPPTWTIAAKGSSIVDEDAGSISFTITRSDDTIAQTVYVSTVQNQGSTNNGDYADKLNEAFDFAVGEDQKQVILTINDDNEVEDDETFGLIVQQLPTDPLDTYFASASFSIIDNDVASGVFVGTWSGTWESAYPGSPSGAITMEITSEEPASWDPNRFDLTGYITMTGPNKETISQMPVASPTDATIENGFHVVGTPPNALSYCVVQLITTDVFSPTSMAGLFQIRGGLGCNDLNSDSGIYRIQKQP